MSVLTEVLKLFKYDPATDGDMTFNLTQCLNNNWDKLDAAILLAIAAAGAYNPEESYAVGDYCTYKGKLRKCSTAIPTGETWTEAHWTTTTVAAEMQELSSQLSNRLLKSGDTMMGDLLLGAPTMGTHGAIGAFVDDVSAVTFIDAFDASRDNGSRIQLVTNRADVNSCYIQLLKRVDGEFILLGELALAIKPQEFSLPLAEGVTTVGACYKNIYSKDQFGIVRVWFSVHFESIPASGTHVFNLPEGFRPDSACCAAAVLSMAEYYNAIVTIHPSGDALVDHGTIGQSGPINLHRFIEFPAAS